MQFKNKYGIIPIGTRVYFEVENQNCWAGGNDGILSHDGNDFFIVTQKGSVTIGKGYDAYVNTIRPVKKMRIGGLE